MLLPGLRSEHEKPLIRAVEKHRTSGGVDALVRDGAIESFLGWIDLSFLLPTTLLRIDFVSLGHRALRLMRPGSVCAPLRSWVCLRAGDGEQLPVSGHPSELMDAAIGELDA